jgi:hypothetical protein
MSRPPRVAINLRLPAKLREALRAAARRNGHSVTAEIVRRLERSIRADERREQLRRQQSDEPEL